MTKPFCRWALLGSAALFVLILGGCEKPQPPRTRLRHGRTCPGRTDDLLGGRERLANTTRGGVPDSHPGTAFSAHQDFRHQRHRQRRLHSAADTGRTNGQTYRELANGEGVDNWFGVLRTISPGETQQGNILFDVPLTSYKLRVPDISDPGFEEYASVQIPLQMDPDVPIQAPIDPTFKIAGRTA